MKRREFITLLGGAAVVGPRVAWGQQGGVRRIGVLAAPSPPYTENVNALLQGLKEAGYSEGQNVAIEFRWAEGNYERLPALATELVNRQVAVMVTMGGAAPLAAAIAATSTVPIVFHLGGDPVKFGFVTSLNRPGGNVTGVSFLTVALAPKRLGLLHELVPAAKIVGLLVNPSNPNAEIVVKDLQEAAAPLSLQLLVVQGSTERDIEIAFGKLTDHRVHALLVDADTILLTRSKQIAVLAERHSMPAIFSASQYVDAGGGLMSYGSSITDAYRLTGVYTGRVLNGEKPSVLPVIQSAKFDLVINLKAAKAIGLEIPPKLLALADRVIE